MSSALRDLAAIFRTGGKVAKTEVDTMRRLIMRSFPGTKVSEASTNLIVKVGQSNYKIGKFVEGVLNKDAKLMESLRAGMKPSEFRELNRGIVGTRGVSNYTAESLGMMSKIREPIADLPLTKAELTRAAKSEQDLNKLIKSLDTSLESSARLAGRFEKLES
uniref:Uncharacterized protein n=1 Tax=Glypta fumiferanae TaxID=389681 RepID=A0A0F6Q744_9HYME|nr:hypothetical protein [Glypta fumiferanae]